MATFYVAYSGRMLPRGIYNRKANVDKYKYSKEAKCRDFPQNKELYCYTKFEEIISGFFWRPYECRLFASKKALEKYLYKNAILKIQEGYITGFENDFCSATDEQLRQEGIDSYTSKQKQLRREEINPSTCISYEREIVKETVHHICLIDVSRENWLNNIWMGIRSWESAITLTFCLWLLIGIWFYIHEINRPLVVDTPAIDTPYFYGTVEDVRVDYSTIDDSPANWGGVLYPPLDINTYLTWPTSKKKEIVEYIDNTINSRDYDKIPSLIHFQYYKISLPRILIFAIEEPPSVNIGQDWTLSSIFARKYFEDLRSEIPTFPKLDLINDQAKIFDDSYMMETTVQLLPQSGLCLISQFSENTEMQKLAAKYAYEILVANPEKNTSTNIVNRPTDLSILRQLAYIIEHGRTNEQKFLKELLGYQPFIRELWERANKEDINDIREKVLQSWSSQIIKFAQTSNCFELLVAKEVKNGNPLFLSSISGFLGIDKANKHQSLRTWAKKVLLTDYVSDLKENGLTALYFFGAMSLIISIIPFMSINTRYRYRGSPAPLGFLDIPIFILFIISCISVVVFVPTFVKSVFLALNLAMGNIWGLVYLLVPIPCIISIFVVWNHYSWKTIVHNLKHSE